MHKDDQTRVALLDAGSAGQGSTAEQLPGDAIAAALTDTCTGPFSDARDCPIHKPSDVDLVERLAAWDHHAWAGWTRYLLDHLTVENIQRWERQIVTPYAQLNEAEKESDRKEAREILAVLRAGASPGASSWQPIETAPNDGRVLFWLEWREDVSAPYEPEHLFMGKKGCWSSVCRATHWMPLPNSPRVASPGASPREDLRLVLQALVDKIEILGPLVDGYIELTHVRSGTHYAGPNWIRELANAKAALRHGASPGASPLKDEQ